MHLQRFNLDQSAFSSKRRKTNSKNFSPKTVTKFMGNTVVGYFRDKTKINGFGLYKIGQQRRRPLEFEVGDHVFLKVMLKRGVVRFDKRGKLSLRYIGPFEAFERVVMIAYQVDLLPNLSSVHVVFHVSIL